MALAVGKVVLGLLGVALFLQLILGRVVEWIAERLPRIDWPGIPWPDIDWPDLPELTLPGWLLAVVATAKYWVPILVAVGLAVGEVRRRTSGRTSPGQVPARCGAIRPVPPTRARAILERAAHTMRTVDPEKHRQRRLEIIGAAIELFATKGLARTTTAEICRAAGTSAGNLFHYFPSKQAIFYGMFERRRSRRPAPGVRTRQAGTFEDGRVDDPVPPAHRAHGADVDRDHAARRPGHAAPAVPIISTSCLYSR